MYTEKTKPILNIPIGKILIPLIKDVLNITVYLNVELAELS